MPYPGCSIRGVISYFTYAELGGVIRVMPSRTGSVDAVSTINLLIESADSSIGCSGQYWHDGITWALDVGDSSAL